MKFRLYLLLFYGVSLFALDLPDGIQGNLRPRFQERPQLLKGGGALFDDCAIAVGSASLAPGKETLARSVAHASARAELVSLVNGVKIKAADSVEENGIVNDEQIFLKTRSVSEISALIENTRQTGARTGGEWISADGKTLYVCLVRYFSDIPGTNGGELPPGVTDWKIAADWNDILRGSSGLLKGGAGLVCDDYGERYILAVAACPGRLPVSQQNMMLKVKASVAAVAYSQGTMLEDMRYVKELIDSETTGTGDSAMEESVVRHFQTSTTEGVIRGLREIGRWSIDGGRQNCGAYFVRLNDIAMESFEVKFEGTDETSDTVELSVDTPSAELLSRELPQADIRETRQEIVFYLPETSPIFAQEEKEIVLLDPLFPPLAISLTQMLPRHPTRLRCVMPSPLPRLHRLSPLAGRPPLHHHRVYLPVRIHRPGHISAHHHPSKSIILRRGAPPPGVNRMPRMSRPPRLRIRHPHITQSRRPSGTVKPHSGAPRRLRVRPDDR